MGLLIQRVAELSRKNLFVSTVLNFSYILQGIKACGKVIWWECEHWKRHV